jgi:hypothetical protein
MSVTALTLNASNAAFVANLLEMLPPEIKGHIIEFNPKHRKAMSRVFDSLFRFVFCPSYYNSVEDEIRFERENQNMVHQEMTQINRCRLCNGFKESYVLLKQMKIGFWLPNGDVNDAIDVNYCAECYDDIRNWDRLKYVKHYVVSRHVQIYPYCERIHLSPNDTIETINKSVEIIQNILDSKMHYMHSSQYDNACDQLEDERQELIYLYEESHLSSDDEYDSYYDRKLDGYDSF